MTNNSNVYLWRASNEGRPGFFMKFWGSGRPGIPGTGTSIGKSGEGAESGCSGTGGASRTGRLREEGGLGGLGSGRVVERHELCGHRVEAVRSMRPESVSERVLVQPRFCENKFK